MRERAPLFGRLEQPPSPGWQTEGQRVSEEAGGQTDRVGPKHSSFAGTGAWGGSPLWIQQCSTVTTDLGSLHSQALLSRMANFCPHPVTTVCSSWHWLPAGKSRQSQKVAHSFFPGD